MFGLGEPEHPQVACRPPLSPMKEEGLNSQLSAIRNWMQPTVIDQGGGRYVHYLCLMTIAKVDVIVFA